MSIPRYQLSKARWRSGVAFRCGNAFVCAIANACRNGALPADRHRPLA
ncbi:MAG UNVERIFIED_CONTAM: hypothetical protein LVR18_28240 [Planctomycetaceae bacterium]